MKKTVIALAIFAAMAGSYELAHAETTLGLMVGSIHTEKYQHNGETWNNFNPGLYVNHDNWVGGVYYNSERRTSAFAGYNIRITENIDLLAGAVTGYRGYTLAPLLIPSVHFPLTGTVSARINLAIGVKGGASAINFALEWKL